MRTRIAISALAMVTASPALAGGQSSDTSSDSSSNNGVVRQRIVDTYCAGGYCERTVQRRVYRDDRRRGWERRRYRNRHYRQRDRDDD